MKEFKIAEDNFNNKLKEFNNQHVKKDITAHYSNQKIQIKHGGRKLEIDKLNPD